MSPPTTSDLIFVAVNAVIVWSVMRLEKRICNKLSEIEKNTRATRFVIKGGEEE